jgi:hypothetical protein
MGRPPARVKVFDDEQHVVNDDPPFGHARNPTLLVPFELKNEFEFRATTPTQRELRNGFRWTGEKRYSM